MQTMLAVPILRIVEKFHTLLGYRNHKWQQPTIQNSYLHKISIRVKERLDSHMGSPILLRFLHIILAEGILTVAWWSGQNFKSGKDMIDMYTELCLRKCLFKMHKRTCIFLRHFRCIRELQLMFRASVDLCPLLVNLVIHQFPKYAFSEILRVP